MRKFLLLIFALYFIFVPKVSAFQKDSFVTVANPVRGPESWSNSKIDPLELPRLELNEATISGLPATWMLRYDAVKDASMSAYFKNISDIDKTQSLGAFLEITPNLAKSANVDYPKGYSIFNANRIFLSGYYPNDRIKLIDTYMVAFKERFGFLPKSVGAWHLDSFSLDYLQKRYSVLVALICDDQYSTDGYRIWGGYLGSPYIPSKTNVLVPAQSSNDRIDIVVIRWAQRDLFNFYGYRSESSYSVQINDYLSMNENTDYFGKLVTMYSQSDFNEFTHVNLGLENDYSKLLFGKELINSYKKIASLKDSLGLEFVSLETLGNYVLNRYPETSPAFFYKTGDPTGKQSGDVYWYQNAYYRLGMKSADGVTKIIDFRTYNPGIYEDFFATPNIDTKLSIEIPAIVDSVKYPGSEVGLNIDLNKAKIDFQCWQVTFTENDKKLILGPKDIGFTNIDPAINSKDISISSKPGFVDLKITPHIPFLPQIDHLWFLFAIFIPLILISLFFNIQVAFGLIFALISTFTVIRSGSLYPFGLGIWGPNGHDAIFHISLIEKFVQQPFNLNHPQIAGSMLSNYHFVFDYLAALVSKVFALSPATTYFVIFPIATSLAIVFLLGLLLKRLRFNSLESILAYFFVFLSGSFGYIPALINGQNPLYSESVFWANQSISLLLNPPFALSIVVILIFLLLIEKYKKPTLTQLLFIGLVGGLLAQTKIYAFILICLALLFTKKIRELSAVAIVGVLFTLPFTKVSGSPFLLAPLWFVRSMFSSSDRVPWPKLVQAWQTYEAGGVWLKLYLVNLTAVVVFLVGNIATRLFSIKYLVSHSERKVSERLMITLSIFGIIIPLIIIQNINPWNTIQFMYYSLFFLGIFTAPALVMIVNKIRSVFFKAVFIVIFLTLTVATTVGTIQDYLGFYSSSRLSYTELLALEKLSSQPRGVVLSPLFSSQASGQVPTPKPLYSYVSTAYISAFSGQPEYLSDTINLDITGYDYTQRSRDIQRFYQTENKTWAFQFLKDQNISYVYETPLQRIKLGLGDLCLTKIFDSQEINIYKFNCHVQN